MTEDDRADIASIVEFLTINCANTLLQIQSMGLVAAYNDGELFGKPWEESIAFAFSREQVDAKTHVCLVGDWFGFFFKARFKISRMSPGGVA